MHTLRLLTVQDALVIAHHRRQMFLDMGKPDDEKMVAMLETFKPWVRSAIARGVYTGFLAEVEGRVVAGLGVMLREYAPRLGDSSCAGGYILNIYTEPAHRNQGLAGRLVERALEECRARGIQMVTLHASEMGQSLYQKLGFEVSNEMIIRL
jgi:GNAT superfamily N-acetyltransferase